jgi:ubiquinone/menaquinone biosynthesis C-methylase UbiE
MLYKSRKKNSPEPFWGIDTQPERLAATLRYASANDHILDLGAGRGAYTKMLNLKGLRTIGVDSHRYPEWSAENEEWFVQASASCLPFVEKQFELTISFEVLEHCDEPEKVLREIARVTSKYLILSVPNCDLNNTLRDHDLAMAHWTDPTHCNFFTKDSIQTLLSTLQFNVIEVSDCYKISPGDYFWDSLRIPKIISKVAKKACERLNLAETYWSSILVVAEIPVY